MDGELCVGGRIHVDRVVSQQEAERHFGRRVWRARDHVICDHDGQLTIPMPGLVVPLVVARSWVCGRLGPTSMKFTPSGGIDTQTLRGVRELAPKVRASSSQCCSAKQFLEPKGLWNWLVSGGGKETT